MTSTDTGSVMLTDNSETVAVERFWIMNSRTMP